MGRRYESRKDHPDRLLLRRPHLVDSQRDEYAMNGRTESRTHPERSGVKERGFGFFYDVEIACHNWLLKHDSKFIENSEREKLKRESSYQGFLDDSDDPA